MTRPKTTKDKGIMTKDKVEERLGRRLTAHETQMLMQFHAILIRYPEACKVIIEHEEGPDGFYNQNAGRA